MTRGHQSPDPSYDGDEIDLGVFGKWARSLNLPEETRLMMMGPAWTNSAMTALCNARDAAGVDSIKDVPDEIIISEMDRAGLLEDHQLRQYITDVKNHVADWFLDIGCGMARVAHGMFNENKITRRQLREIIKEVIDTQLSRAISKGNLPDARPDEKRASRRAERRFGKQQTQAGFDDDYPPMSGLGPADDHLESITSQDMADAKRHARSDLPRDQADYLDISVEDWHRIRQEMDEWYEERHMLDQEQWIDDSSIKDDDPDTNNDGMLSVPELVSMVHNIVDDIDEDHA